MKGMYDSLNNFLDVDAFENDIETLSVALEESEVLEYEQPTLASTRKETRLQVKEELARLEVFKRIFSDRGGLVAPETEHKGESICLLFSDWHVGKVIKVDGQVVYDSKIATERISRELVPQITSKIERLGRASVIDDINIFFLGDLIENDIIFENQKYHIDVPVSQQVNMVVKAIIELLWAIDIAIEKTTGQKRKIRIFGITGNHGRASGKKEFGGCSWDTVIYSSLETALMYSEMSNITVDYTYDPQMIVKVKGHKGLLRHWAPAQVQTSAAKAKFGGWRELYDYDFLCYGHYHNWGVNTYHDKPIFRNGSLCGTDGYAMELALGNSWGQLMWGVDSHDPVTFITRLK